MAWPLAVFRGLLMPPADRRLASALAASEPAAQGLPPIVPLRPGSGDGSAQRRRVVDEQRQGVRTPWVPVGLHWRFEDLEATWQAAEMGNLDPLARMVEAMRHEGVTEGLVDVRCNLVRKPTTFTGDPGLCDMLRGQPATVVNGVVRPGKRGLFRRMYPIAALKDMARTGTLAGIAVAEMVDDPISGLPVMHTRDLHRLRYDWGERCWKYIGERGEYLVEPGNGRWILFMPEATHRPWRAGRWLPLSLAFVVMLTTTYDAARYQARSADPLKVIEVPNDVPPDEVDRLDDFLTNWWERSPGIVLRYGAKADIVEANGGTAYNIYKMQREWAAQQVNFTLRGSMGTSGEGEGIFNDPTASIEVADELIQSTADSLAECISEQGIGPWAERYGLVRHRDEAPTFAWDTRSPARKLAEAKAAGEVAANVLKMNAALQLDGRRVDAVAYFLTCGLTIPTVEIVSLDDGSDGATDAAAEALATKMTLAGEARCEHGSSNRCRLCGVERERDFEQGPDGTTVWRIVWRAIGRPAAPMLEATGPGTQLSAPGTTDAVVDQSTAAGSLD